MNRVRRKRLVLLFAPLLLIILPGALFTAVPKTGYCFDSTFDQTGERLYVTAGRKGVHVFEVSLQGRLRYVTTYFDGGYYRYIEVADDKAYIANSRKGLEILDIQDDVPKPVWAQRGSKGYGVHVEGDRVYLASDEYGLQILDVKDPEAPVRIGSLGTGGRAWDVWVNGEYAFVADHDLGLIVVNVSVPSRPHKISSLSWCQDPMAEVIDGAGEFVYIASGQNGLIVIDVSDPREPAITSQYDPGPDSWGDGVLVHGDLLHLSIDDASSRSENGLHTLDLTDPSSPRLLSKYPVTDGVEDVSVAGAYLAMANTLSGVVLFDIGDPGNPSIVDTYPEQHWRPFTQLLR
jgi:hypothetical protein